jgi:hypothetical protein
MLQAQEEGKAFLKSLSELLSLLRSTDVKTHAAAHTAQAAIMPPRG